MPFAVQCLTGPADLLPLALAWSTLLSGSRASNVFLTWEWITTWWKHFGGERELAVLQVQNEAGETVGIAPLCLERRRVLPLLSVRVVTFVGLGGPLTPDYLDLIALPEHEAGVAEAVLEWLLAQGAPWDVFAVRQVPGDAATIRHLAGAAAQAGLWVLQGEPQRSWYATLPATPAEYESRYIGRKTWKRLREDRNRLARVGTVRAVDMARERSPAQCIELIARLHGTRSAMLGRGSAFDRSGYRAFHEELAALAAERGWLRLWTLLVDEEPVACRYGFSYQGVHYAYQTGLRREYADQGVGRLALQECIRGCIEEGLTRFDMLAGEEDHKRHFCKESRWQYSLLLARPHRRGVALPLRLLAGSARRRGG